MTDPPASSAARGALRVLLIGSESGAADLEAELRRGGYEPVLTRASTEEDLAAALGTSEFDVAVCEDRLTTLGAPDALRQIKRSRPHVPVIVVSSFFGESIAGAAMKAGADDFIAQGYFSRLVPAIEREIRAARTRQDWERAARDLRETQALGEAFMDNSPTVAFMKDEEGRLVYSNRVFEELYGPALEGRTGKMDAEWLPAKTAAQLRANDLAVLAAGHPMQFEEMIPGADGVRLWLVSKFPFSDGSGRRFVGGVAVDISERKKAENSLRVSEDLYRDLMEHSHVLICVHDLEGRIVTVNDAAERNLGYDRNRRRELIRIQDFLAPESLAQFANYLDNLSKTGLAEGLMTVQTRNGEKRYWEYRNTLRTEGVEKPIVRGIAFDVTDRIRAERDLQEARQFSEAIIASAGEGIIVYGPDLRYVLWNPFMEELTGIPPEDVLGRSPLDLFPQVMEQGVWTLLERALSGEKVEARDVPFVVSRTGRSGWISATYTPHRNADGRIVGVIGIVEDVTESHHAAESLRESRESLEQAQAVGQVGSWVSDLANEGTLVWSKETCRIFGLDPERFDGKVTTFFARVHPEDLEAVREASRTAVEETGTYGIEHRIVRPDGSTRWVYERADLVRDTDGRPLRMVGIVQDITDRRRLEEQFLQSQKMEAIGRLAGGIAHDFNNLLTAILGYADLLLDQVAAGDPMRGDLEEIQKAGERAASLTRQLLAFSRRQLLEPKVIDVNGIVNNLEKMLRRLIGEDIELHTLMGPEPNLVRADPGQLEQVLMNLVVNSRDAMPTGGTITIETRGIDFDGAQEFGNYAIAPGQYVRVEVRDTGMGMDTATLARVFEPFFTTKEVGKGTGLGLATAYGIVKQSGGYIACDSQPGVGTRFQIFLPRSLESAAPVGRKVEAAPGHRGAETVLLVEDEEGVRRLSRKLLEAYGYQVLEAATGSDAIALAERYPGPIHLMLTDIVMPGMDGPTVASRIQPVRPQMKVLYMSGYSEAEAVRLAAVAPLLQKPFTPENLARRVRETLAG